MNFFDIISQNASFIILGLSVFCLLLFILTVVALCKASKIKKRMNDFIGQKNGSDFEEMLKGFIDQSNAISEKQDRFMGHIKELQRQIKFCVQKVGVVRYNPFEDVGGDLCYAVALLNENDDGIVLNSVYSRDGCYTYAKPIEKGQCVKYKLSDEEEQAVKQAMQSMY